MVEALDDAKEKRFALAVGAARKAGLYALHIWKGSGDLLHSMKGNHDFLSLADKEVESIIIAELKSGVPDCDTFVGEELGGKPGECVWVIDPIDGTSNYINRLPDWCISIAFMRNGVEELAVIYAPVQDKLYSAILGKGAWCNGNPIHVANDAGLDRCIVELDTGNEVPTADFSALLNGVIRSNLDFRRIGSAALSLARVASGQRHAFFEMHSKPWDSMAGALLVREAGGWTNNFSEEIWEKGGNMIIACIPLLRDVLVRIPPLSEKLKKT